MLARPTLTRPVQDDASKPKSQVRPTEERFLLRVDGQIKRSFSSKEDAATAGAVIKKAYPLVVVTVVDAEEHQRLANDRGGSGIEGVTASRS